MAESPRRLTLPEQERLEALVAALSECLAVLPVARAEPSAYAEERRQQVLLLLDEALKECLKTHGD